MVAANEQDFMKRRRVHCIHNSSLTYNSSTATPSSAVISSSSIMLEQVICNTCPTNTVPSAQEAVDSRGMIMARGVWSV